MSTTWRRGQWGWVFTSHPGHGWRMATIRFDNGNWHARLDHPDYLRGRTILAVVDIRLPFTEHDLGFVAELVDDLAKAVCPPHPKDFQ